VSGWPGTVDAGTVSVARLDLDLVEAVGASGRAKLERLAWAHSVKFERGAIDLPTDPARMAGWFGLLVLDGVLVRHVEVGAAGWIELLGGGDVVRSWTRDREQGASFPTSGRYEVVEAARLALLDDEFARRVAPFPELAAALIGRAVERSRWLVQLHASAQPASIDERVWMVLWQVADRWGRVTPRGVELRLAHLTHEVLAVLLGARRPTVTTAVRRLAAAGLLTNDPRGRWVLHGEPSADVGGVSRRRRTA
jgi:hypothetical protein